MDKEKVLNLAKLARIEMGENEAEKLSQEFEAILKYVSEVKKADESGQSDGSDKERFPLRNIMRADGSPHESGQYTEALLSQAPQREGDYIKVKKIL